MSIPFSNTHYRIPRGFANLLEGLTREVLRDQPQDIPLFAAKYFAKLLKDREESGFDPAEWGSKLEDRFYNNHSFQHVEDNLYSSRSEDGEVLKEAVTAMDDAAMDISEPLDVSASIDLSMEEADEPTEDDTSKTQPEDEAAGPLIPESAAHPDAPSSPPAAEDQKPTEDDTSKTQPEDEAAGPPIPESSAPDAPSSPPAAEDQKPTEDDTSKTQPEDAADGSLIPESSAHPDAPSAPPAAEDQKKDAHDSPLQDQAATVIQAAIRGHLVRREVKRLREEEPGNKTDFPEPSDVTLEQISVMKDIGQETHMEDSDFTESQTERSHDSVGLEAPNEDTSINEGPAATKEEEDTSQHKHQDHTHIEGFPMEIAEDKTENVDNMLAAEGAEVVHTEDTSEERSPEAPQTKDVEEEPLEPEHQTHDDLVEEQKEHPEETTDQPNMESTTEDVSGHTTEPPAAEETSDQPTEQPIIEDTNETMEQPITEDVKDHTPEPSAPEETSYQPTEQPVIEYTGDQAPEQSVKEDTGDHTNGQSVIEDIGDQTTDYPSDHGADSTVDQQASLPVPDHESAGKENETCRKHQEEVLDIDLDDPGANAAAAKIQAGFRGHMTRKKMKGSDKELKHKDGKAGSSAEGSGES